VTWAQGRTASSKSPPADEPRTPIAVVGPGALGFPFVAYLEVRRVRENRGGTNPDPDDRLARSDGRDDPVNGTADDRPREIVGVRAGGTVGGGPRE
jgi:hypothetical protein